MILTEEEDNYFKFLWLTTCCRLIKYKKLTKLPRSQRALHIQESLGHISSVAYWD